MATCTLTSFLEETVMKFAAWFVCALSLIVVSALLSACGSDPSGPDNATITTSIFGRVFDEEGEPVAGATVKGYGALTTTDADGIFTLNNLSVPSERCFITCSASGFFDGVRAAKPRPGAATPIEVTLIRHVVAATVNSQNPVAVELVNGGTVQLPANGVKFENGTAYNGKIEVLARLLRPDSEDFRQLFPGDIVAQRANGTETTLLSYGMMIVELRSPDGQPLNLSSNASATLTFPIPEDMVASAPTTIALWYFDKTIGKWKEEGTATKIGKTYQGSVSHFTPWNCDVAMREPCRLHLRVITPDGKPVGGAKLVVGQVIMTTDGDGHLWSYGTTSTTAYVDPNQNYGIGSEVIDISCVEGGLVERTIVVQAATVTGALKDCDGKPVAGLVQVLAVTGAPNTVAVFGQFGLLVPANQSLSVFVNGGNLSVSVNPLQAGQTISVGDLLLCKKRKIINIGSTYTYNLTAIDSNGVEIAGSAVSTIHRVVQSGSTISGNNNVSVIVSTQGDTTMFAHEQNGDITFFEEGADFWIKFPLASRVPQTVELLDTLNSGNVQRISITTLYDGSEEIRTANTMFVCQRIKIVLVIKEFDQDELSNTYIANIVYWYSPEIDYFPKIEVRQQLQEKDKPTQFLPGSRHLLTSYSLL